MVHGEYKNILLKVFDVLEFSEKEKTEALEAVKRKLGYALLISAKDDLPEDQKDWVLNKMAKASTDDPEIAAIRKSIKELYSKNDLYEKSKPLFRDILKEYVEFISQNLAQEKTDKLQAILKEF